MNHRILSTAVLILATVAAAPLAQARDGRDGWNGRDHHRPAPVYRERYVERHYYHPDRHHGWHQPRDFGHHRSGYYPHYRGPAPHHYGGHHRPGYYRSSSAPIILGSVIGGVVGHEIGYGDPGHTAAGAVIGTVIGYEIARQR
ncbi:hypothetical protein SCL_2603 [Sulfuricaulis limicola]|uniref:Uncharacterized protein n=1 Tax=Sulfuricaulis limicola TaxID=1620215 RepID=A0A1B4XJA3_9GAMM|nr:glycine zipper 2TM domain-containing protein [Sulfuricaulis limicola]BAV34880.1 hypothetical protein SCL_2603 [Sulfuricaulis limicola]